jgi:tryptophan synthase alpha subunit
MIFFMKDKLIKVCGMREGKNILDVEQLGVDMIGLIFYSKSPRCVCEMPEYLPQQAKRVGVFVNERKEYIQIIADRYSLDYIQLHGDESPEFCRTLQLAGLKVIKNFPVATERDLEKTELYEGTCDYFLFDTKCKTYGGSGKSFDWDILHGYNGQTPFILSGGINLYSTRALKSFDHPQLAGYDINSRFETKPGEKDVIRIAKFIKQIKDMNRINQLFDNGQKDLLSIYFCAGAPTLNGTVEVIKALEKNGVSMIEIGIPFSDPMADGIVIQNAATQALHNGMSLKLLFEQLQHIRQDVQIPLVLMGYLNPIMRYGFERFCQQCVTCGIDGVIIPDLPFKDYQKEYRFIAEQHDIKIIMLITPETSEERVREIDQNTDGFIYMVSSAATTGVQKDFNTQKQEYFKRIKDMRLKNPLMVGFGISNKATFDAACKYASGAIIGSRFVTLLDEEKDPEKAIKKLIQGIYG